MQPLVGIPYFASRQRCAAGTFCPNVPLQLAHLSPAIMCVQNRSNDQRYSLRHLMYRVALRATKLVATNTSTNAGLNAPARCPLYAVFLLGVSVPKH